MVMSWKTGSKLLSCRRKSVDNHPLNVPIQTLDVDQISSVTDSQVTESLTPISLASQRGDFTRCSDLVAKIKELVPSMSGITVTEGLVETLVKHIREPISPKVTKASLVAIFYVVSSDKKVSVRFAEMGLVSNLLDMLVDAEKSVCEKAIGVLNQMFSTEKGREEAYEHALAVPILVKKMFRVSEAATEFAVSALWKLCKGGGGRGCVVEALLVGAFQKLLLLLQVGCSEAAKGKASDLFKLLNASRAEFECVESMDFKDSRGHFEDNLRMREDLEFRY